MVCYYENWSQYRDGVQKMMPSDIDPSLCTHVLYAFAKITDGVLAPIEWNDFSKLITLYIIRHTSDSTHPVKNPCMNLMVHWSCVYSMHLQEFMTNAAC